MSVLKRTDFTYKSFICNCQLRNESFIFGTEAVESIDPGPHALHEKILILKFGFKMDIDSGGQLWV